MPAPQSPAFLSAKKCSHLSRQHFWVLKNARTSVASISEGKKMPAPQSPAFLSAKKCQRDSSEHFSEPSESGDHLFDHFYPRPASGADLFSLRGRVPSRETTFLTVFTPVPHRERTFSVCEVVSRVGRAPFSL